jgi:5-methylcytosine-specific restriction protein A
MVGAKIRGQWRLLLEAWNQRGRADDLTAKLFATFFSTQDFWTRKVKFIKQAITNLQIEATYAVAKRVFAGELDKELGAKELHKEQGMNLASARDYIKNFSQLMHGSIFHRTMNVFATDYYFTNIFNDYGANHLAQAISAVQKHINYYENLRPVKLNKLREVIKRHSALLTEPVNLTKYEKSFSKEVEKSFQASTEARKKRLKLADKQPKKAAMLSVVFIRNPDVVAEVLHRANGNCERCKISAPFLRKRDKTPYLEVHHIVQLADGGEDAVENALALCPNCHRELHFG